MKYTTVMWISKCFVFEKISFIKNFLHEKNEKIFTKKISNNGSIFFLEEELVREVVDTPSSLPFFGDQSLLHHLVEISLNGLRSEVFHE